MFFKRTWINPQILGIFWVKIHKCVLWASALKKGRGIKSLFSTICNMFTFAYLLLNFVGVAMKWWAMTTQMTRISNVGITKFVTLAQTTQVFWKEGHLPSYIMYANFPICNKNNHSQSPSCHHHSQNWQNYSHHQLERSTCTQTCRSSCAGWLCWTSSAPRGEGREPNRPELSENSWHVNSIGQLLNRIGQLLNRIGQLLNSIGQL